MKATDERYHVGLGVILYQHPGEPFSFDRSATFADLWAILFRNLVRHPIKSTLRARRYMPGRPLDWHPLPKDGSEPVREEMER